MKRSPDHNGKLPRVPSHIIKSSPVKKFVKKTRFTEEQVVHALKKAELGMPVAEVIQNMGVSRETFYRWKRRYGGLSMRKLRHLDQLEEENLRLKQMVAGLDLYKRLFREILSKKYLAKFQL